MAKTALRVKASQTHRYKTRNYSRCTRCGRSRAPSIQKFGALPHLPARSRAPGRRAGHDQVELVGHAWSPIPSPTCSRACATRISRATKVVVMPSSKLKIEIARVLSRGGLRRVVLVATEGAHPTLSITLQLRGRPPARHLGHQAHQQAGPAHLRQGRPPAQGARRPRHRHPVHPDRSDHQPRGRASAASAAKCSASSGDAAMSRIGKKPIPIARRRRGHDRARARAGQGPEGRARAGRVPRHGHQASRTATSPSRARPTAASTVPCTASRARSSRTWSRASPTGYAKRLEIQGVGYRAALRGRRSSSRSATRTRSPCKPPQGIEFEVPAPTQVDRARASTSRPSARSQPRSAACARRSRTRARASATQGEVVLRKVGKRA